jgi:U4/U6.U5 tri-snRNP component SNU23
MSEVESLKTKWEEALAKKREKEQAGKEIISKALKVSQEKTETNRNQPYYTPPTRAFLKNREKKLELDKNVNKIQIVNLTGSLADQPGFYCKTCDVLLKSSEAYLDHCNGRRHQKLCGFSLRVERSSLDDVKNRLQQVKKPQLLDENYDLEEKLKAAKEEKERLKAQKKEQKKKQKIEEQVHAVPVDVEDEMKAMGFDFTSFK